MGSSPVCACMPVWLFSDGHTGLFLCQFDFKACNVYIRYMTRQNATPSETLDMMTGEHVAQCEGETLKGAISELTAEGVADYEWNDWLDGLRRRETVYRNARLRLEALRSGEVLPECEQCGETIVGRSDARYCSTRCRVAAHRAKSKAEAEFVEPSAEERFQKLEKLRKQLIESGERPAPRTEEDRRADAREFVESLIARKRK